MFDLFNLLFWLVMGCFVWHCVRRINASSDL